MWGTCLIVAPVLGAVPAFLVDAAGRYGVAGGAVTAISSVFWLYGVIGLFGLIRETYPAFGAAGLLVALYGIGLGGISFGLQGFYEGVYGLSKSASLEALAHYPVASNFVLWGAGYLFPPTIFALGVALRRARRVALWTAGMICLAALVFPVSRITRVEWIMHSASVLLLVPFAYLGWTAINGSLDRGVRTTPAHPL